jgi:uncharacterized protein
MPIPVIAAFSTSSLSHCIYGLSPLLTNRQFLQRKKSMPFPLPEVTPETKDFWTGGAVGELRIMACAACDHRIHPPQLICPKCLSREVAPVVASGRGTIHSYTINRQAWMPDLDLPYAIGVIDLDDQPGVRITARMIADDVSDVHIGASVGVAFEARGDVFVPLFRLA